MLALKMKNKHSCIKWNDPILPQIVTSTHELVKCLCHAATYDLDHVLLLIGNRAGKLIFGMFIQCDSLIKAFRLLMLEIAYNHGLKWAHEHINNPPEHLEQFVKSTVDAIASDIIT